MFFLCAHWKSWWALALSSASGPTLFYFVYATFKPHILLFHHDTTYLASHLLVHTSGNTGTALITTHYGNVSLQTTCFNHQQLHGHIQVCYPGMYFVLLFYTVLNLGCLNFSYEPLNFIMMKFTARCGCMGITNGAVSSTTVRQDSNKSSKTGQDMQKLGIWKLYFISLFSGCFSQLSILTTLF